MDSGIYFLSAACFPRKLQMGVFLATFLSFRVGMTMFQACPFVTDLHEAHDSDPDQAAYPQSRANLRHIQTEQNASAQPTVAQDNILNIVNFPAHLPWKVASREGPDVKVVPVDFGYVYNPPVLELADGTQVFAGRMSWLYGGECHAFAHLDTPEAMYKCFKTHVDRFAGQSVIGLYHPSDRELEIISPSNDANIMVREFSVKGTEYITAWNGGPGWFDTRLVYPYYGDAVSSR